MQFWPPGDEHMCLKHVEAWNKLIIKQKFITSSWLITEINNEYILQYQTQNRITSKKKIYDILHNRLRASNTYTHSGIYELKCHTSNMLYIGQTGGVL